MTNSLQAVLNAKKAEKPIQNDKKENQKNHPGRAGKVMIGGHFSKEVAKQLKMLAIEGDTTNQKLLEEALDLLFIKKGKGKF
jgi:hypothetical protein